MAKSFQEFTIDEKTLYPYLLTYLPSPPVNWNLTDYDGESPYSVPIYRFTASMLDGFNPEELHSRFQTYLLQIVDSEDDKIKLSSEHHDQFIFLLFYYQALIKHVTREYKNEIENARVIKDLLQAKITFKESTITTTDLTLDYNKAFRKIVIPNISSIDIAIEALLKHHVDALIEDYSDINLKRIVDPDVDIAELKAIANTFNTVKDYKHILITLATHFLGKFLNEYAEEKGNALKSSSTFTSKHIRFLMPFFDTLKWRYFNKMIDKRTQKLSYTNSIKSFRSYVDELQ